MNKKYELLAIYNDCIAQGDDPLTAINKVAMTNGVTKDDLIEMDNDLLGGFMSDVINTPLVVCPYEKNSSSLIDDILNDEPFGIDDSTSIDSFDGGLYESDSFDLGNDYSPIDDINSGGFGNDDGFDPFDF